MMSDLKPKERKLQSPRTYTYCPECWEEGKEIEGIEKRLEVMKDKASMLTHFMCPSCNHQWSE